MDLDNFWLSDLLVFGFTDFNPLPSLTSSTLLAASISAPSTLLVTSIYNNMIVFSIDVSDAAILLSP